jgi:hypothetical protein
VPLASAQRFSASCPTGPMDGRLSRFVDSPAAALLLLCLSQNPTRVPPCDPQKVGSDTDYRTHPVDMRPLSAFYRLRRRSVSPSTSTSSRLTSSSRTSVSSTTSLRIRTSSLATGRFSTTTSSSVTGTLADERPGHARGCCSEGLAINDADKVVGRANSSDNPNYSSAFLYSDG